MHFLLVFSIFTIILRSSFSVQPGDPFPTDQFESKKPTSEDIINGNDILDPTDNEIPSEPSRESIDFIDDEENSVNNFKSTSTPVSIDHAEDVKIKINFNKNSSPSPTKPVSASKFHRNDKLDEKSSSSQTTKLINQKNLIKIVRWKHEDLQTKTIRYWYETEGGRMGIGWTFDGYLFQVYDKLEPHTEPVYAFHSEIKSIWTNTIQMDPNPSIIGNDQWIADGVLFYAYKTSMNSTELQPVFRYWNKLKTDSNETRIAFITMKGKDDNDEDRSEWTHDEILFYALPIKN